MTVSHYGTAIWLVILIMMVGGKVEAMTTEIDDRTLLEHTYKEMYRAMIAKDTATLANMLDDSFVLVHMTGMRQPKREYLRAITNGTLNYYSCDDTRLDISVKGEHARMIGRSRVSAAVFGGGRHTWLLQLDITLRKQGGRWFMTEIKAGTY